MRKFWVLRALLKSKIWKKKNSEMNAFECKVFSKIMIFNEKVFVERVILN